MNSTFLFKSVNIYYCGKEECRPGHAFGPFIRPHYLIHFILSGRGSYEVGGKRYDLSQGDAFLICPGESTYYRADSHDPWHYAWVAAGGTEIETLLKLMGLDRQHCIYRRSPDKNQALLRSSILHLIDKFLGNQYHELDLLSAFYQVCSLMQTETSDRPLPPRQFYVQEACTYIHNNYSYEIQVQDIASHIGIDRTYLYKLFMEEKGISPQQYLILHRLREALFMLCNTSFSITEIALSCGFKDVPSFSRHFKKHEGISPRQFRKTTAFQKGTTLQESAPYRRPSSR